MGCSTTIISNPTSCPTLRESHCSEVSDAMREDYTYGIFGGSGTDNGDGGRKGPKSGNGGLARKRIRGRV